MKAKKQDKVKYLFIKIEERNGEQEYTSKMVRTVNSSVKNIEKFVTDTLLKVWYNDDNAKKVRGEDWYEFFGGCIMARLESVEEISKEDFDVLNRYL
jgi:hypothetical protein